MLTSLGVLPLAQICHGQEDNRDSLASRAAAEQQAEIAIPDRFNVRLGSGGVKMSAGLKAQYLSNVYLTHDNQRDDFVLTPNIDLGAFFPVGRFNTFALDLGVSYDQYLKNDELNTGTPRISPNTQLAFNIYAGDFVIKLSEAFSYQESPFYEYGGSFYNVYNTGLFSRFDNRVGPSFTWDLKDLVVTGGYAHHNFFSNGSAYDYIDRSSEEFQADAFFAFAPSFSAGFESHGSLNAFDNRPYNDHWRAGAGPGFRFKLTDYLSAQMGGGYERIQYTSDLAPLLGLDADDTYYAYASLDHTINRVFSHSLSLSHNNQIGINAANLAATTLSYSLAWKPNAKLTISPAVSYSLYDESYNSGTTALYHESFDYYYLTLSARYDIGQHWYAGLGFRYVLKDSENNNLDYDQFITRLEITYVF